MRITCTLILTSLLALTLPAHAQEGKPSADSAVYKVEFTEDQVRACVVGCATGEEAYSIAILLAEHASTLEAPPTIKVFATDIDELGLEMAASDVTRRVLRNM